MPRHYTNKISILDILMLPLIGISIPTIHHFSILLNTLIISANLECASSGNPCVRRSKISWVSLFRYFIRLDITLISLSVISSASNKHINDDIRILHCLFILGLFFGGGIQV